MHHSVQLPHKELVNVQMDKLQTQMEINVLHAHNIVLLVHHKLIVYHVFQLHSKLTQLLDYVNLTVTQTNILELVQETKLMETKLM
jgi:hypothetical protein